MQREFNISLSQEFYSDTIYLSQYDTDYNIVFHVKNKYAAASVDGLTAKFTGLRPPAPGAAVGLGFEFSSTGVGSDVTFAIDNTISAVAGTGTGEIVFYNSDDMVFGSANVQIIVEPAAHPNDAIDADVEEEQELADAIREMIEGIGDDVTTVVNAKDAAIDAKNDAVSAKNNAVSAKNDAVAAKNTADADALKAEGYAVGKQGGTDVASDSPYYHNNAAYYAGEAGTSASAASASKDAAAASATAAASNTAAAYSSSATYAVGDYCVYNGQMYRCTTAITTAEAWTNGHWTAVSVGGEFASLKEDLTLDNYQKVISRYNVNEETATKAYIGTNGSTTSYNNSFTSDYIPVIPNTTLYYKLAYIYGITLAGCFYDSAKQFIQGSGIVAESGTAGSWKSVAGSVTVPNNAAYFRFMMSYSSQGGIYWNEQYVSFSAKKSIDDIDEYTKNPWAGKKWCCFGTSITDAHTVNNGEYTGMFVPYLCKTSNMIVTDRGIAGASIGSGGVHSGSSAMLNKILGCDDLNTFDLITIEGFVNDYALAITLGELGDTENTTFYGALHQAISYCLSNSYAEIVLITDSTGKDNTENNGGNFGMYVKNSLGLYQQDYNDAVIKIAQFYGVHVIDAGGKSQINQYHPAYIKDHIHHTQLGGEQYAKTIWEELKNITPAKLPTS